MAKVKFGGIVPEAWLECLPGTPIGGYVLVPAGFALGPIGEAEASLHTRRGKMGVAGH